MWSAGPSGTHGDHQSPSSPSYFEVRVHPGIDRGVPPRTSFVKPGLNWRACTTVPANPDPGLPGARRLRRVRWRSGLCPTRGVAFRSVPGSPSRAFGRGTPRLGSGTRDASWPLKATPREVRGCPVLRLGPTVTCGGGARAKPGRTAPPAGENNRLRPRAVVGAGVLFASLHLLYRPARG